jgi:cellulose synthase/poly-beta-1,6-N-acetylglucosamine synthase-like glycosyltransferase
LTPSTSTAPTAPATRPARSKTAPVSPKASILLILDADFVPNPDLLQKTIHYFTDDKIGMIQTRWGHLNRTFNVLTRIQAMFLDGHLELEQTARNRSGRFFTFNGTGGIWRKSCIADAGGWEHDTLTEDMDLSYRAQLNGWRFIFLNDVETPAELPVDMDGFKSQQHRWTKGSIQVCKKVLPAIWRADVPLFIKLEATAHLTSNFAYLLLIVLCFLIYPNQQWQPDFGKFTYYIINVPDLLLLVGIGDRLLPRFPEGPAPRLMVAGNPLPAAACSPSASACPSATPRP